MTSRSSASGNAPSGEVLIRPFRSEDAGAFFSLNTAWINQWFALEPEDLELLQNPGARILGRGGRIFVAELHAEVIGCFALLAMPDGSMRLARMAVREDLRGHGIGRMLLDHAINTARALHAGRLVLETSRKLASAVHLYEAAGFQYVSPDPNGPAPLARAELYMELRFSYG